MDYIQAIKQEELIQDTYSFCPCVICFNAKLCTDECKTFVLFTNTEGKKRRKKIFMNKIKQQVNID